jgi:hypothetical protein
MTVTNHPLHDLGLLRRSLTDDKKGRVHAFFAQHVEDSARVVAIGPVVERQSDYASTGSYARERFSKKSAAGILHGRIACVCGSDHQARGSCRKS